MLATSPFVSSQCNWAETNAKFTPCKREGKCWSGQWKGSIAFAFAWCIYIIGTTPILTVLIKTSHENNVFTLSLCSWLWGQGMLWPEFPKLAPTYYLTIFFRKLHENETLARGGGGVSHWDGKWGSDLSWSLMGWEGGGAARSPPPNHPHLVTRNRRVWCARLAFHWKDFLSVTACVISLASPAPGLTTTHEPFYPRKCSYLTRVRAPSEWAKKNATSTSHTNRSFDTSLYTHEKQRTFSSFQVCKPPNHTITTDTTTITNFLQIRLFIPLRQARYKGFYSSNEWAHGNATIRLERKQKRRRFEWIPRFPSCVFTLERKRFRLEIGLQPILERCR